METRSSRTAWILPTLVNIFPTWKLSIQGSPLRQLTGHSCSMPEISQMWRRLRISGHSTWQLKAFSTWKISLYLRDALLWLLWISVVITSSSWLMKKSSKKRHRWGRVLLRQIKSSSQSALILSMNFFTHWSLWKDWNVTTMLRPIFLRIEALKASCQAFRSWMECQSRSLILPWEKKNAISERSWIRCGLTLALTAL